MIQVCDFSYRPRRDILGDTKSRSHVALVVIGVLGDTKSPTPVASVVIDVLGDTKSPTPVAFYFFS
jgi:hypothetical protein